jgi:DNA-binding transcriptional regulator GbsR (MarR family)
MDKDILEARERAIQALTDSVSFWGIDPMEARVYGTLFLSTRPMTEQELVAEVRDGGVEVAERLKVLERLGAVKKKAGEDGVGRFSAESDFFEILQTILRERREREIGRALSDIEEQRDYIRYRASEDGDEELTGLAGKMDKLHEFIHLIDKMMFGLRAVAGLRGIFHR